MVILPAEAEGEGGFVNQPPIPNPDSLKTAMKKAGKEGSSFTHSFLIER